MHSVEYDLDVICSWIHNDNDNDYDELTPSSFV